MVDIIYIYSDGDDVGLILCLRVIISDHISAWYNMIFSVFLYRGNNGESDAYGDYSRYR